MVDIVDSVVGSIKTFDSVWESVLLSNAVQLLLPFAELDNALCACVDPINIKDVRTA
jgi:hypothetical protein